MRAALLLVAVAVAACPAPHATDGRPPASTHEPIAVRASDGAGDMEGSTASSAGPEARPPAMPPTTTGSVIDERTRLWVVASGACVELRIRPRDEHAGVVSLRGVRIDYVQRAGELELGPASRSEGEGLVSRPCRTVLRMGPGSTLGGATLFDDEAACITGLPTAAPLDDSAEATAGRCRGEPAAVTTDEVECGVDGRHAVRAGHPGCVGVALTWP